MKFELDVSRQVLQPGDELVGWVTADDPDLKEVSIIFSGEEMLGANDVARCLMLAVAEDKAVFEVDGKSLDRQRFKFTVPRDAPPSFATRDIRCFYVVKAIAKLGFWKGNRLRKLQLTILPSILEDLKPVALELETEHPDLGIFTRLDQTVVLTGDVLSGSVVVERKTAEATVPRRISLRLAAILESSDSYFSHREVLMLETKELELDASQDLPFFDKFEIPIPKTAEPSGTWNTFRVHYGFRVSVYDHLGKDYRSSALIRVLRDIQESRVVSKGLE